MLIRNGLEMAVEFSFKFPLPSGLHARPASQFEAIARNFASKIELINQSTGVRADARSVLSMVSADIKPEQICNIQITGADESDALEAITHFIKSVLPDSDTTISTVTDLAEMPIPRSLTAAGLKSFVRGISVSGGIGRGHAVLIGRLSLPARVEARQPAEPAHEISLALAAIESVGALIGEKALQATHIEEVQVLNAHAAIVRDPSLLALIQDQISNQRRTAAQAIVEAGRSFSNTLQQSQNAYLRERVLDVEDIYMQLLDQLTGVDPSDRTIQLHGPSICFAEHLTPGQLLSMNRKHLKGLVLSDAGTTSHTVILARSMNVPTLVDVALSKWAISAGDEVLVDGELGLVVRNINSQVGRYYAMETARLEGRRARLDMYRDLAGMTADQLPLEVGANITSAEEAVLAFDNGAQGIGLFRTEMVFTNREQAPSEQEQTSIYSAAAQAANGNPVIIRLLDIGGDKPLGYLDLPHEDNPFLGNRGVRLYREFSDMLITQLRAILRAAAVGNVKILVPMVCCMEEVQEIRQMISKAMSQLHEAGTPCEKMPQLGVMIEVPAMAFIIEDLCTMVDFFSIGTNDLTQYFVAADRTNPKVISLHTWSHPAFVRMLKCIVNEVHAQGKWIGLCGEMGDDPAALPLLIGLGLDEISVSVPKVMSVKAAVSKQLFSQCHELLQKVLLCSTRNQVETVLENASTTGVTAPLVSPELIFTSDAASQEEVIKQLADQLYMAQRVATPALIETAIWAREDIYSTGFGYGFAVPHCKSDLLSSSSIVIAKLTNPVDWKSLDAKPVSVVILLAIRDQSHGQEHLKLIARLSRLVMREEFRRQLQLLSDLNQMAAFVENSLEPDRIPS